ncbi:HK97 family phage prohead protease [Veillonella ratti]|uniref:HK97 family phage prohead protease n=1 Tax=Veillonella ratti TaxID=103892 RepID=UPI000F8EE1C5|nr:HK97 family phage prohead protease [Veillonella ratti]
MKVEIRNGQAIIEGYVNVTERTSLPLQDVRGKFVEKVRSGTFKRALEENRNIDLMYNHKRKLGDQASGMLELREDNVGLYARAVVNDAEVIEQAEKRQLKGWSFGFKEAEATWEKVGETEVRNLNKISLQEVSILSIQPAYLGTTISVRENKEELLEYRAMACIEDIDYDMETRKKEEGSKEKDEEKADVNQKYKDIVKALGE